MLRIRRLYFYLVLYVSLFMLMTGLATLVRVLLERLLDVPSSGFFGLFVGREQTQEQTALGIALVVVGLPVWGLHWRTVQKWLTGTQGVADRTSALRRLYVYGVLLTTAFAAYSASRDLIENMLALALGQAAGTVRLAGITGTLPFALVAGLFWFYHWQIAATDRRAVGEDGASATLRRWYLYAVLVFSAVVPDQPGLARSTHMGSRARREYQWHALRSSGAGSDAGQQRRDRAGSFTDLVGPPGVESGPGRCDTVARRQRASLGAAPGPSLRTGSGDGSLGTRKRK